MIGWLAKPESGIGTKTTATLTIKCLGRTHQPQVSLLDEVEKRDTGMAVLTRNSNHQTQICLDQLVTRPFIASGDALRQFNLLGRGEATKSPHLMQVALKKIFSVSSLPSSGCAIRSWAAGKVLKYLGLAHLFSIIRFGWERSHRRSRHPALSLLLPGECSAPSNLQDRFRSGTLVRPDDCARWSAVE